MEMYMFLKLIVMYSKKMIVNSNVYFWQTGSIYNQWKLQECHEHVSTWSGGALALCFKWYVC